MNMRTKLNIIGFIVLAVVIIASLLYLYDEYGFWGLYASIILYLVGITFILDSYFELKRPHHRVYHKQDSIYYKEPYDYEQHYKHLSNMNSHNSRTKRHIVQQTEKVKMNNQQYNIIHDYSYFGKKKDRW